MKLEFIRNLLRRFHTTFVKDLPSKARIAEERALLRNLIRYKVTMELLPRSHHKLKVIDIGSGWGHIAYLVQRIFGYEIVAVDTHRYFTPFWTRRFKALGIEFKFCDLTQDKLPFPNNSFDIALLCEVIEHLPIDPRVVLMDIRRVLKPKGVLILSTPNFARLENRLKVLLGRPIEWYGDVFKGRVLGHIREYTPEEVRDMLLKTGFKIDKEMLINYSPYACLPRPLYNTVTKLECILVRAIASHDAGDP